MTIVDAMLQLRQVETEMEKEEEVRPTTTMNQEDCRMEEGEEGEESKDKTAASDRSTSKKRRKMTNNNVTGKPWNQEDCRKSLMLALQRSIDIMNNENPDEMETGENTTQTAEIEKEILSEEKTRFPGRKYLSDSKFDNVALWVAASPFDLEDGDLRPRRTPSLPCH